MEYGDEYGELIGDAVTDIETHVEDGLDRLAYALGNAENFRKMLTIFLERTQSLEHVMRGVSPTLLFDITTAYGVQLDQIGNLLGFPREGWDDVTYRVYLKTQALIILPDRRTQGKLIDVIRSLFGGAPGAIGYSEYRSKGYVLGVTGFTIDQVYFWNQRFYERCRPATYNAHTIWHPEDAFGYTDATYVVTEEYEGYSDATDTVLDIGGPYSAIV